MAQSSSSLASRFAVRMSLACVALSPPHSTITKAAPREPIDAVTWTVMDAHLAEAFPDGADVTGIAHTQSINPRFGPGVGQVPQPFRKDLGLADFSHREM
jgi:hypothetical protein